MIKLPSLNTLMPFVLLGVALLLASCNGSGSGANDEIFDFSTVGSSVMRGPAYYLDLDLNSASGSNDRLVVPFNQHVSFNNPRLTDFSLPVTGDSFGTGGELFVGQGSHELTIKVGNTSNIKTRGLFSSTRDAAGAPSGLDSAQGIYDKTLQPLSSVFVNEPADIVPGFVAYSRMLGEGDTHALVLGDLNNDGRLDVVEGNFGPNEVWLYGDNLLHGSNFPVNTLQELGDAKTTAIALADFDGDGDLDMAEGASDGRTAIRMNDGTGAFTLSLEMAGIFDTRSLVAADFDRDGDVDIAEGNSGQANRILLNDGAGGFTDSGQSLGANDTESLAAYDMDRDGDLDLVAGNYAQPNLIWLNNGYGVFTDSGLRLGKARTRSIVAADVDDDGDADLIAGNDGEANRIWINNAVGISMVFGAGQEFGKSATQSVIALDIDGDGFVDLVEGNLGQEDHAWFNDGTGLFTRCEQVIDEEDTHDLAAGDVDGDGDIDFVAAFGTTAGSVNKNLIYLNSLTGTWGPSGFSDSGQSWLDPMVSGAMADLDDDGDLDIVTFGEARVNVLLKDDYTGQFYIAQRIYITGDPQPGLVLVDLDRDGDIDVACSQILWNKGTGLFTSGQLFSEEPLSVAVGDVDRDGDLDLVHGLGNDKGNRVWLNDGRGNFLDSEQSLGSADTTAVVLVDVEHDGDLDIIEGVMNAGNRVWLNNGAGLFADAGLSLGGAATRSLAICDVDSDGAPDFIEGIEGAPARIWINASLANTVNFLQGAAIGTDPAPFVLTGDVNHDGYCDVVAASGSAAVGARLYRFDRYALRFTGSGEALGFYRAPLGLGDIDSNGSLDLLVAGDATESVTIRLNY